ncbi:hypothetical protein [Shinella granuli]|uniref:Uncharacterized protein n=1 Tax=Shinella granuli TaxID=323621 RepID=A0A4R2CV59_SHIGR|nr:hypothetical protein [Shinella granuli]TCN43524.1 hypothetical protein EV665_110122 [Shinella granuli]
MLIKTYVYCGDGLQDVAIIRVKEITVRLPALGTEPARQGNAERDASAGREGNTRFPSDIRG